MISLPSASHEFHPGLLTQMASVWSPQPGTLLHALRRKKAPSHPYPASAVLEAAPMGSQELILNFQEFYESVAKYRHC